MKSKSISYIKQIYTCLFFLFCFYTPAQGQAIEAEKEDFVMEHVEDAHSWHLATIGHLHLTIPLPIILYSSDRGMECFSSARFYDANHYPAEFQGYLLLNETIHCIDPSRTIWDLSITKNVAAMLLSACLLISVLIWISKQYQRSPFAAPKGYVTFVDLIISFIKNEIAIPNIGKEQHERFLPYLLTSFCFIWLNNLLGLLPGGANVTGSISVTCVLAAFTTFLTIFNGNKHYWAHIFKPEGVPIWLLPIMIPVEILGIFTKFFALMVRLFANITAGHIILISIIGLVFNMKSIAVGLTISLPFGTFMFLLKLLVAVLQAYVFTLLSAIYFGQAVGSSDH